MRETTIMATAGPTLFDEEDLVYAIKEGVSDFRLHMGSRERDVCQYIKNIKNACLIANKDVGIFLDLPSSRPRVSKLPYMELEVGKEYIVNENNSENNYIPIPGIEKFIEKLKVGERFLFRDGKITLLIKKIDPKNKLIYTNCVSCASKIGAGCSCVMPDSDIVYESVVQDDILVFDKMKKLCLFPNYIGVSFASNIDQLKKVKEIINSYWPDKGVKLIAKIENKKGIDNFMSILGYTDGVLIGRGDLALHIDSTLLPTIQKEICEICNKEKKICIVGTEFFESYASTGVISRPELTDVACAARQRATSIMLSMESASSRYPLQTIKMVSEIIRNEYHNRIQIKN